MAADRANPGRRRQQDSAARERFVMLYQTIRDRICLIDYAPGEKLSEESLAEEFGVSRTPLRRALIWLESEGLVRSVQGVGTIVTDIDLPDLLPVYRMRMELAALIGQVDPALPSAETLALFDALKSRAQELERHPAPRDFAQLNIDFFKVMMRLTENAPLRETSERYFYQSSRIWLKSIPHLDFPAEIGQFRREIDDIHAAVHLNDLVSVGRLASAHISMSYARLFRSLAERPDGAC